MNNKYQKCSLALAAILLPYVEFVELQHGEKINPHTHSEHEVSFTDFMRAEAAFGTTMTAMPLNLNSKKTDF